MSASNGSNAPCWSRRRSSDRISPDWFEARGASWLISLKWLTTSAGSYPAITSSFAIRSVSIASVWMFRNCASCRGSVMWPSIPFCSESSGFITFPASSRPIELPIDVPNRPLRKFACLAPNTGPFFGGGGANGSRAFFTSRSRPAAAAS